jgi:hypothetical protein
MSTSFALGWIARQVNEPTLPAPMLKTPAADRFGSLWPLVQVASVLPVEFDANLLAGILAMDEAKLKPLIVDAQHLGGLVAGLDDSYSVPPEVKSAAYADIPAENRRKLHRRTEEALSQRHPVTNQATSRIAHQFEMAEDVRAAFDWWVRASKGVIEDAAPELATQHLERALALSLAAGASEIAAENKLVALRLLGPLLAQLKGSGSKDVAAVYAHCLEIAERMTGSTSAIEFDVLWGLSACILVHGRVETAGEMNQRLVTTARASGNETQILLATRLRGLAALLSGELDAALVDFRAVQVICDATDYTPLRFTHASDQSAIARAHQSWAEAMAGDPDASAHSHTEALDQAEQLQHPHTSAHVLCVLAARAQTLGLRSIAAPLANAALTIARQQRFAYWEAWAEIILAWNEGLRGSKTSGARIDRAIQAYRDTGAGQALPYAYHLRASLAIAAGDFATAIAAADAGPAFAQAYGIAMFQPTLLLDKAEATADLADKHALIAEAGAIAHNQNAHLYVHRAAALSENAAARCARDVTQWQYGAPSSKFKNLSFGPAERQVSLCTE